MQRRSVKEAESFSTAWRRFQARTEGELYCLLHLATQDYAKIKVMIKRTISGGGAAVAL